MAARIRILDAALADQIAAGEVVERPASVVKELIENAVDAGARRIDVEIEDGGQKLIAVSDDGSGMSRRDAQLCVQRHATSKISVVEDLFAIRTLGFRGEALPSIASVSRFSVTTRANDEAVGTRVIVDGTAAAQLSEVGCAQGTRVEVRDLFFNVPARLKFLKAKATEGGHVSAVVMRAALAHPEVTFRALRDGRVAQEFLRASDRTARVRAAFPDESLSVYEGSFEGAALYAALGAPERARSGAAHLHLFVNRRPVRDTALARAVTYAYGSVLPPGRFPHGVLYLEVDPREVDVNVHPQKLEVKLAKGRTLLDALTRFLAKALGTSAWSGPGARAGRDFWSQRLGHGLRDSRTTHEPGSASATPSSASETDPWQLGPTPAFESRGGVAEARTPFPASTSAEPQLIGSRGFFSSLRPLGQAQRMFLVCEGPDALYVIDQHAADERVRYDHLRRAHASRDVKVQQLLFPERVECTEIEAQLVEDHADALQRLGLPTTRLGPTTVAVAGVPALLRRAVSPAQLVRDVWSELQRSGERAFSDAIDMALATMACHGAIRAGDALSPTEIGELLRALDAVEDFQGHCPHGRPVVCDMPWSDLETRLGR